MSLLKALNPRLQKITDELYQQMKAKKYINYDTASFLFEHYQKQNNKKIFLEMAVKIGLSKSKVRNLGDKVVPSIYSQLYEKCFQIYAITLKLKLKKHKNQLSLGMGKITFTSALAWYE